MLPGKRINKWLAARTFYFHTEIGENLLLPQHLLSDFPVFLIIFPPKRGVPATSAAAGNYYEKILMCNEPITIHNFFIPFGTDYRIPAYYEQIMNFY